MVEPITGALAGFALFKSAVSGLKSAISTANDVRDIGGFLEQIWASEKQITDAANKEASVSSLDHFKGAANATIERKLMQEELNAVRSLIQHRFGVECWSEIIQEKARREREAAAAIKEAKRQQALRQQEMAEAIKTAIIIFCCVAVIVFLFVIMFVTIARSSIEEIAV